MSEIIAVISVIIWIVAGVCYIAYLFADYNSNYSAGRVWSLLAILYTFALITMESFFGTTAALLIGVFIFIIIIKEFIHIN